MELHTQTLLPSPTTTNTSSTTTTNTSSTTTTNTSSTTNTTTNTTTSFSATLKQHQQIPITRSESNPYPTTFVQADTSSFKQVVQMLTGSSEPIPKPAPKQTNPIPPMKSPIKSKPSKLYERRSTNLKNLHLSSNLNNSSIISPRNYELLSPSSFLDFPSLVLSPVTPLTHDPFNRSPVSSISSPYSDPVVDKLAEDKAIAEKGFFLHPSPVSTPRDSEPRLLPLFPVTSPRVIPGSNSSS